MESEEYSDEDYDIPRVAPNGELDKTITLPEKSKHRYAAMYELFTNWQTEKLKPSLTENVLLEFFEELATTKSPATLWSSYSMLRSTLHLKHGLDISNFSTLKEYIRNKNQGYVPPKPKLFTDEQVNKFIDEAPDHIYLATKVALIFTLIGACKTDELVDMSLDQIETHGRVYLVKIPNFGSNTHRSFTISDQYFDIVEKYRNLRPPNMPSNRFFCNHQKGKCTVQFIGKNKFTKMPKQIAEYLNLEEPDRYTGHSVRSTKTTYSSTVQKPRLRVPKSIVKPKRNKSRSSKSKAETLIKSAVDELNLENSNGESSSVNFEPESPDLSIEVESADGSEISSSDQARLDGDVSCEDENRMKLINKYFTFENCTNVHITFFSKP